MLYLSLHHAGEAESFYAHLQLGNDQCENQDFHFGTQYQQT